MLVILKEPHRGTDFDTFAVNIDSFELLIIRRAHQTFQLAAYKHYDALFTPNSALYHPVAELDSYEECEKLLNAIIDSMSNGDKVFRIAEYLEESALQNQNLPKV